MSETNRRRHPRLRIEGWAAQLHTELGRSMCWVENISVGGLFLRTDQRLPLGALVWVGVSRPGMEVSVTLAGRVVSTLEASLAVRLGVEPGLGVQFTTPSREQAERLGALVQQLLADGAHGEPQGPARRVRGVPLPVRPVQERIRPGPVTSRSVSVTATGQGHTAPEAELPLPVPDAARLVVQIRETQSALSVLQVKLEKKEEEVRRLYKETVRLQTELRKRDALLAKLGQTPGR